MRTKKQIERDRDRYLQTACLLRDLGDMAGYETYIKHVEAMDRELDLRRYGTTNVL